MLFVSTGKDAGSIRFRKVLFPRGLCSAHLVFCHVQEFLACSFHTLIIGLRVTDKEDLFLVFQACFFFSNRRRKNVLQMPLAGFVHSYNSFVNNTSLDFSG